MRLLVIDDDPLILRTLRRVMEVDGHLVVEAHSGQKGIEAFQAAIAEGTPFTVVITDLTMPYMNGNEVARLIKAMSASTPVIQLTGWGTGDNASEHVDYVIGKPPRLKELREALLLCGNSSS